MMKSYWLFFFFFFCQGFFLNHYSIWSTLFTHHPNGLTFLTDTHLRKVSCILKLFNYFIESLLHQNTHITSRESLSQFYNFIYLLFIKLVKLIFKCMQYHILSGALIWQRNVDSSRKSSYYGCVQGPRKISCSQHHGSAFGILDTIHLSQKLCFNFLSCFIFIVTSC